MQHVRVVKAEQFDLCTVCGAYAELDDLEKIICYACTADIPDPITTIESYAHYGLWHPLSETGQRIAQLRHTLAEMNAACNEAENQLISLKRNHISDSDWTPEDGANELYETREELEDEVDTLEQELDDIYRRLGDIDYQLSSIHPTLG